MQAFLDAHRAAEKEKKDAKAAAKKNESSPSKEAKEESTGAGEDDEEEKGETVATDNATREDSSDAIATVAGEKRSLDEAESSKVETTATTEGEPPIKKAKTDDEVGDANRTDSAEAALS